MWREQVSALSDIRRVIAPNLDGHGENPAGEPKRSMDEIARSLAEGLDSEGVSSVDVAGFSMGGYAALTFCRLFPDRVNSLALVDSRTQADSDAGRAGRDQLIADIERRGSIAAAEAMLPKMFTDAVAPELRDEVEGWMRQQPPAALVADLLAIRDRPDSGPTVARLSVPLLVVAGLQDPIIPVAEAEAIAHSAVYGRLVVVDGASHLSPLEQPQLVNDALRKHLGG
jgi:pimeloyl-ACP methyl ester carboxylesterase